MKKIMEGAVNARMGKSGIVVPKSGLIIAELDEDKMKGKILGPDR
jgi:hypothetical protein